MTSPTGSGRAATWRTLDNARYALRAEGKPVQQGLHAARPGGVQVLDFQPGWRPGAGTAPGDGLQSGVFLCGARHGRTRAARFAARPWVSNAVIVGIPPSKIRIKNHLSPVPFQDRAEQGALRQSGSPILAVDYAVEVLGAGAIGDDHVHACAHSGSAALSFVAMPRCRARTRLRRPWPAAPV